MPHYRGTIGTSPGGPLVDLLVGVSRPHEDALRRSALEIPSPVAVRGLIDTGASGTVIDPSLLSSLNLTPTSAVPIHTPSTSGKPKLCDQFDVSLVFPLDGGYTYTLGAVAVIESHLAVQGIDALIGRDVLERGVFIYDGVERTFLIGF